MNSWMSKIRIPFSISIETNESSHLNGVTEINSFVGELARFWTNRGEFLSAKVFFLPNDGYERWRPQDPSSSCTDNDILHFAFHL